MVSLYSCGVTPQETTEAHQGICDGCGFELRDGSELIEGEDRSSLNNAHYVAENLLLTEERKN